MGKSSSAPLDPLAVLLPRLQDASPEALQAALRRGLPRGAVKRLAAAVGLREERVVRALRLDGSGGRLDPARSDRVYRLARVARFAHDVLGDPERARDWLLAANRSLGGAVPLDALDTDLGAQQVEDALHRIRHGIFG